MTHQCSKRVYSGREYLGHQCERKAAVEEGGKWYCRQHAPSAFKARRDAANARYKLESTERVACWAVEAEKRKVVSAACDAVNQAGSWDAVADAVHALREAEDIWLRAKAALDRPAARSAEPQDDGAEAWG